MTMTDRHKARILVVAECLRAALAAALHRDSEANLRLYAATRLLDYARGFDPDVLRPRVQNSTGRAPIIIRKVGLDDTP
jgi:hypothetical protein